VTSFSSSSQYWKIKLRAKGTHFAAGTVGTANTLPFQYDFTTFTGYGVILNVATVGPDATLWNFADSSHDYAQAEFQILIPTNADPTCWFGIQIKNDGTTATVTEMVMELQNLPQSAAITPFMAKSVEHVKKENGEIDFQADKHVRNVRRRDAGEVDVKCNCQYCLDGVEVPLGERQRNPELKVHLVVDQEEESPVDLLTDAVKELAAVEKSGWSLFGPNCRTVVGVEPVTKIRPKDKTVRIGEAKNPGPPKFGQETLFRRGHQIPVHSCSAQLARLQGILKAKTKLPSSQSTRAAVGRAVVARKPPTQKAVRQRNKKAPQSNGGKSASKQRAGVATPARLSKALKKHVAKATLLHAQLNQSAQNKPKRVRKRNRAKRIGEAKNPGPVSPAQAAQDLIDRLRYRDESRWLRSKFGAAAQRTVRAQKTMDKRKSNESECKRGV